jgi:hypothetical protein
MSWIRQAAKLGARAVRNAPKATQEARSIGERFGKSSKVLSKVYNQMRRESPKFNQNKRWVVNDSIKELRNKAGRTGNALASREMQASLRRVKAEVPKMYQQVKDFVTAQGRGLQRTLARGPALRDSEAAVLRTLRQLGYQGKDPKRALKVIRDLSERNLLPAAVLARLSGSRKEK